MATLKFYNESLSQPVRAVWMFLKINNIPFEDIKISAFKGEYSVNIPLQIFSLWFRLFCTLNENCVKYKQESYYDGLRKLQEQ